MVLFIAEKTISSVPDISLLKLMKFSFDDNGSIKLFCRVLQASQPKPSKQRHF